MKFKLILAACLAALSLPVLAQADADPQEPMSPELRSDEDIPKVEAESGMQSVPVEPQAPASDEMPDKP